ncbi:MAG: DNA alkylation repair protein [Oscillospiraceae bacterium]|nr:DNA alkylation repair protein [Oscillospiraceae bacterium]
MKFQEVYKDLSAIENIKTKDVDKYNKKLIKEKADVSDLKDYILKEQLVYRTYFQVSMGKLKDYKEQFAFVEENAELLQDWWHVDQLIQFIKKPVDFDFAFNKAKEYINSPLTFLRRWGYVLFLAGLQKDSMHTNDILSLIKDDEEYYVQMAQAWLIADLAVFNIKDVKAFMEKTNIKYNIAGKAIQKMCDSFRITKEDKEYMKSLRKRWKS